MKKLSLFLLLTGLLLSACAPKSTPVPISLPATEAPLEQPFSGDDTAGLANPASEYCEEEGGQSVILDTESGEEGYCIFEDGSECPEWAFYRDECAPGKETRLTFDPGTTERYVEGTVAPGGRESYVLTLPKDQYLMVTLNTAEGENVFLGVLGADGTPLLRPQAGSVYFQGAVPETQEYRIDVQSMGDGGLFSLDIAAPIRLDGADALAEGHVAAGDVVSYVLDAEEGLFLSVNVDGGALLAVTALDAGEPLLRFAVESSSFEGKIPYTDTYLLQVTASQDTDYTITAKVK
jgi:putative hemolysin